MQTMTRDAEFSAVTPALLLAFELGERTWKLGFTVDPVRIFLSPV